jgi:uncharacterized protein YjbI with pentapeptide repeats
LLDLMARAVRVEMERLDFSCERRSGGKRRGARLPVPPNARPATDSGEATPIDERAATPSPGANQAAPATPEPELPEIAKKADDLEEIKKAVEDAATVGGTLWFSYLFVLFYLAVAAGAVTHADLFFENPVKLPFLNIELPLLAFFFLAPILFLIVHAYTLVHLVMLSDKAKRFHEVLHRQIGGADRAAIRAGLQRQLPSNIFVQFLAGPPDVRASLFGSLLRGIAWTTLVVAPVLLLLMMQIQFLPYHSSFITWTHRLALLADLILVWWLWREILSGRAADGRRRPASPEWMTAGFMLSLAVLLFATTVATFPGEWQEAGLPSAQIFPKIDASRSANDGSAQPKEWSFGAWIASWRDWAVKSKKVSLHEWVFNSPVDDTTRRRWLPLSSTLVLPGLNIYEGLKIDDPEKVKGRNWVFRARGRDLKGAIFDLAILPKVDFKGAGLEAARLESAQLQDARLDDAELQGASLSNARLQGASLVGAQLQRASLSVAQLQGASLAGAQLQGASLVGAELQGASLGCEQLGDLGEKCAQLQGASLADAQLQGASLDRAQLQGASLVRAQLQGASLQAAILEATDLSSAWLWRTNTEAQSGAPKPATIRLSAVSWAPSWKDYFGDPHTWDDKAYQDLRKSIEDLPTGYRRDQALKNIGRLDCASPDKTLAACKPDLADSPPPEAAAWRQILEAAAPVDDEAYALALAKVLKELVCSGGDEAVHVVRGLGVRRRLIAAGGVASVAVSDLIDDLANKDSKNCLVSAALTDADRATLLRIKQEAMKDVGK